MNPAQLSLSAKQVIDNILEGVLVTDAKLKIQTVNSTFCSVTGYKPHEVIGQTPSILKSGQHKPAFYKRMYAALTKHGFWQGEITNKRKNGQLYAEWLSISTIKNKNGKVINYMAVFTDISTRKKAQETIRHMAYYDALTNLPNRTLFQEQLKAAMSHASRNGELLGVLFLDLDRVKVINDTLGHDMGDRLLKGVADRLRATVRDTDIVARMGGDEFMILLPGIKQKSEIIAITEKILETVRPSFHFGKQELFTTASIGISIFPSDGQDSESLFKNADTAMYRAKHRGRNNFQMFDVSMKAEVLQQLALENGLRRALERKEFVVHYQPQLEISTGEIVGMEALLRWDHPELGLIPPSTFLQWAEDSGLIVPIGEMVLKMACTQNKKFMDAGYAPLKVGVNVSARQFRHSNLIETVARTLKETGLPPVCLDLELTESTLMEMGGGGGSIPHEIKAMGVGFSIDDFGTGYSSLNYLKKLPVTTLKMDQSFVRDITTDPNDEAIASAVIGLGHGLDLQVLAEGVETEGQLQCLKDLKCDQIQGYIFSPAVPAMTLETMLKEKKSLNDGTLFENSFS